MPIGCSLLHHCRAWTVVVHPVNAKRRIELRTEARGEKAVAEEPARCVKNENNELRFRNSESVWASIFSKVTYRSIDVLDVVDQRSIGVAQAIVDRRLIFIHLRVGNDLRRIADMLTVDLAKSLYSSLLL